MQLPTHKAEAATSVKTETFTADASPPELDKADTAVTTDNPPTPTSSVEIITGAPQKSWLSRAMAAGVEAPQTSRLTPTTPVAQPGWDSGTADMNIPVWMRPPPAYLPPGMPVRANLAALPPYKFPVSKAKQDAADISYNRQLALIQKEASPTPKQVESSPHLLPSPQMQSAPVFKGSPQVSSSTLTKNTEDKIFVRDQKAVESEKEPASLTPQKRLPPHLRTPDSTRGIVDDEKKHTEEQVKLPPHLRIPASRVTPSPKTTNDEVNEIRAEAPKQNINVNQDSKVPPHLRGTATHKSHQNEGKVSHQPTLALDEEVAAGLDAADKLNHDEEVAAVIQAESYSEELSPRRGPGAAIISTESFFDQDLPQPAQHLASGTRNHAFAQQNSLPAQPKASMAPQRAPMLQEVTNSRHNSNVNRGSRNAPRGNSVESAVKTGKRPARTADFLTFESDWAGNMAPPPIGSDLDNREKHDGSINVSAIEFWRQGPSGLKLDTEDPDFQTGKGHAGGEQNIISPINQADHIALPNDDDFSQARRGQNAAESVEKFNARMLADGKSPRSEDAEEKRSMTAAEKRANNRARAQEIEREKNRPIPPSEFAPAANIYIRPAEAKDMRQCMEIYNHYVTQTASVAELKPVDEVYWNNRFHEAVREHNPFVVAIHMGQKRYTNLKDVRRKKKENVVGFTVAADYGNQGTCYRYTVEVELYVDHVHLRQGIGGTLLDRMLSALDPGYHLIERSPFLGQYMMAKWIGGGHCICKTVVINILHEAADTDSVEWKRNWLSRDRIDFVYSGTLQRIGFKNENP